MEEVPLSVVDYYMKCGFTYEDISEELSRRYPNRRGFSPRTIRRYCQANNLSRLSEQELEELTGDAIMEVGSLYGRKLMKGFLLSKGFRISESKVASALRTVAPDDYEERRHDSLDRSNPVPYHACHFGHKVHLDQNEKLVMFGVTSVVARDGFSGKIVAYGVMPIKNCIAIYDLVFRSAISTYGLWHQVRVDHGREFSLVLEIQDYLRSLHGPSRIAPYVQSPSTENLTIERIWPEVNSRVNYPIKRLLIAMAESGDIDMNEDMHKFCVSFVSCQVVHTGIKRFVDSWNQHTIPGRGIPAVLAQEGSYITAINDSDIPDVDEAVQMFESQGRSLQRQTYFGIDPLSSRPDLIMRRDSILKAVNPTPEDIFSNVVAGTGYLFKYSISNCIKYTIRLSQFLN